jgi:UDP-3-O-[3-hydroxymyristoyl] glucosamine N-acyltransferase
MRLTASMVAEAVGGTLKGEDVDILGLCTLSQPRAGHLGFMTSLEKGGGADVTRKGVVLLARPEVASTLHGVTITVADPRLAFGQACVRFFLAAPSKTISETARIAPSAKIARDVTIGDYCVVGPECTVGPDTELRHHVVLHRNVHIGARCLIRSHAVIGEEGFGMVKDGAGRYQRIPHFGGVIVEDDVEVGASATIARWGNGPGRDQTSDCR